MFLSSENGARSFCKVAETPEATRRSSREKLTSLFKDIIADVKMDTTRSREKQRTARSGGKDTGLLSPVC